MRKLLLSTLLTTAVYSVDAQQFNLSWGTSATNGIQRVKYAANGDVFALGTGADVRIQRYNAAGALLWTKSLSAPDLRAVDMDVDANDNIYVYLGFTTGQLDLDPGPLTTLVNPGKIYAKYTGNGAFQWGFSVGNTTDLSASYGGISCDDAGNLYITGDLGQGSYDMDPGPGESLITVGDYSTGSFMARYRTDGSLAWARVDAWYSGFSNSRAIAAVPDGSAFYVVRNLDTGGSLSEQIDVDPGPGTVMVYNDRQILYRFDSSMTYQAHGSLGFGDQRLAADAAGHAYLMAAAFSGGDFWALKFTRNGSTLQEVYQTALPSNGNLRLGDIAADGQGGFLGLYSNNCDYNRFRFFKMNVSGLMDFNLFLYSGTDCTLPVASGFDLRGNSMVLGSVNNYHTVDYDPGSAVLTLPVGSDDGAIAQYNWCSSAPYDPFGINVLSTAWCMGDTVAVAADAFGDAGSYTWAAGSWTIAAGQGSDTLYLLADNAGPNTVSVAAANACGTSAPVTVQLSATTAGADLPASQTVCYSFTGTLDPGPCAGCTYLWQPGGATTPTLPVDITDTTTFSVTVTNGTCSATDSTTISIDLCLGIADAASGTVQLSPVPAVRGQLITVQGVQPGSVLRLTAMDGRTAGATITVKDGQVQISTAALAPGMYLLHGAAARALRIVVQ